MPNVAIIVGHTPDSPGATSVGGVSEFPYNNDVAVRLSRLLAEAGGGSSPIRNTVVYRGRPNDYTGLPAKVNAVRFADGRGADIAVELHFNGAASSKARGCEMLYWYTSRDGQALANRLQAYVAGDLRVRDRGVKAIRSRGERGGHLLAGTRMPTVICEPFFGSSPEDWEIARNAQAALAAAYARAIRLHLGLT